MPYVNVQITKGATRDQKSQLVKEITDSLVKILGKLLWTPCTLRSPWSTVSTTC